MLRSIVSFLAVTLATAEYGCSSFAQLTHTASGCPANQGNPDCSFIQANAQQFCSTAASSWEIINGPNCNLRGASYGCIFASGLYSTTDQFCCPLIVVGAAPSDTATASATATTSATATATATASSSSSASATASSSPSASAQPTPSIAASLTSLPTQTASSSATATATATATSTGTFTALPSTNITIIYVKTTEPISKGLGAAIGLSAIFGFVILCGCCGLAFRRRPVQENLVIRQVSIVEPKERRKSVIEKEEKERRKSTTEEGKERRKSTHDLAAIIINKK